MNDRQSLVLFSGVGVFFAMLLYQPYTISTRLPNDEPPPQVLSDKSTELENVVVPSAGLRGAWCGGLIRFSDHFAYDWSVESFRQPRTGEWMREPNTELLRRQVISWCIVVFFAFRAMSSNAEKTHPLPSIESASQMP